MTSEESPFLDRQFSSRTLEFEAHSIVLLYYVPGKSGRDRYLEILKMRGTKHSTSLHEFSIDTKGIAVSSKPAHVPQALKDRIT